VRDVIAEYLFLLRDGLTRLLAAHGFEIAAAVDTAPGLLCALLEQRPDVASSTSGCRRRSPTMGCRRR
jgi:hypothetical protein